MPTVVDAARVTTKANTVWRTCTGCSRLAPLAPGIDRCPDCTPPASTNEHPADAAWDHAHRYAAAVGRIEAWAVLIPDVSDAERLAHIREALTELHEANRAGGQQ